jgi:hypothetical protein
VDLQVDTNVSEEHNVYIIMTEVRIETLCSSEMLLPMYKSTWHHNSEYQNLSMYGTESVLLFGEPLY